MKKFRNPRPRKFDVSDVFSRGVQTNAIETIKRYFIRPFSNQLEGEMTNDDVLNYFFNVLTRELFWVRVEDVFKLPGKYYVAPTQPVDGLGPRDLRQNEVLALRVDKNLDYVDVERVIGLHEHTFRLTKAEYRWLMDKVMILT